MDDLIKSIPTSIISLVGLAVMMGMLVMMGTLFQEWAKSLYRRSIFGAREKRHENKPDYLGIERRSENKELQHMVANVLGALTTNTEVMNEFISAWKASHMDLADNIEEIKRKQNANWKRLFDEGLPEVER